VIANTSKNIFTQKRGSLKKLIISL